MKNIKKILVFLFIACWQLNAEPLTENLVSLKTSLQELLNPLATESIPESGICPKIPVGTEKIYSINGFTIHVAHTSLLNIKNVDAIVNAANPQMTHGGGLSGAIFDAASPPKGKMLNDYISKHFERGIKPGQAVIVPAFNLAETNNIQFIIFAVGANFGLKNATPEQLRNAYFNSLLVANLSDLTSIAFPPISASIYRGKKSLREIAQIGFEGIMQYIHTPRSSNSVKKIIIACYTRNEFDVFIDAIDNYMRA